MFHNEAKFDAKFVWLIGIGVARDRKGRRMNKIVGMCLAIVPAMCWTLLVAPAEGRAADDAWQQMLKRDFGTGDDAMKAIREEVEAAAPDKRPALEGKLIAILESPEATVPAKQFACRMLRYVGSTKCIPTAAKLLTDVKLSHMGRWVLQGIAGPAAEKALLAALGKASGRVRVGIIETLGERRSPTALAGLAGLLGGDDLAAGEGPVEVIPPDGKGVKLLTYVFANGIRMHRGKGPGKGQAGITVVGTDDKVPAKPMPGYHGSRDIHGDFLNCVRTRQRPFRDVEVSHRTATVCHLGNIAYLLKRPLKWDPVKEEFPGDEQANRFLSRAKRSPWAL